MEDQCSHIINYLLYLGVSVPLLAVAVVIFMKITPYSESQLITAGKATNNPAKTAAAQAAAYTLGGKILGLAIILASAIFHSVTLIDLAIWGCIGIVSQVIIFFLYELVTPFKITKEIPEGNISVGILSAFLSVSLGVLLASLISY
jgi:putative membrane protein